MFLRAAPGKCCRVEKKLASSKPNCSKARRQRSKNRPLVQHLDRTLIVNPSQIAYMDRHSGNEAMLSFSNGAECLKIGRVAMQRLRELSLFSHAA